MKNNFTISQRNAIVENHLWCIKAVMKQNRALIRAAKLDTDDVYQQLALRLIRAVMSFDPEKGNLEQHIFAQLHFELLNCKHPYRHCPSDAEEPVHPGRSGAGEELRDQRFPQPHYGCEAV